MLRWLHLLMPREEKFFDLFERHAQTLVVGSQMLRQLLDGGPNFADCCQRLSHHESEADAITRDVLLAVRRTFITPFDRSDIQGLISSMDDAIDQMLKTAKTIMFYEIGSFEPQMRAMGDIIVKASGIAVEQVGALRQMRREASRLGALTVETGRIEEMSDELHDQGLKKLFFTHGNSDAMAFIVGKEVYGHLEEVMDRFEDVANQIHSILIEHI